MPAASDSPERYRFADLLIDATSFTATRDGVNVPLPRLSFDLLLELVRAAPRTVTVDELMDKVWAGRVVNAETVAKRVELVREVLGDNGQEPRYIAVVRGRGYRVLASVSRVAEVSGAPPAPPRGRKLVVGAAVVLLLIAAATAGWLILGKEFKAPTGARITPSIAVLPFVNLSEDPANSYFSDGVSEEILSSLSRLQGLRVASRTSSFSFRDSKAPLPEIARALNVDHIVEGSVRKAGSRIRVTAQLIDVRSDSHLWAEDYDRELSDTFAIQKEIANRIAGSLSVTLRTGGAGAVPHDRNLEAYQLYLRGMQIWQLRGEQNLRQGIGLLERAIELDPDIAQAHAALAITYALTNSYYPNPDPRAMELATQSARRAMALDPSLSQPHAALGLVAMTRRDWFAAEAAYRRAIELNANDALARYWLGELFSVSGRTKAALAAMLEAMELDPISGPLNEDVGQLYLRNGDFTHACPYTERALALSPNPYSWLLSARCREHSGDVAGMTAAESQAERMFGFERPLFRIVRLAGSAPSERPAAFAAIQAETARGRPTLAMHYRALGDQETALTLLESAMKRADYNALRDVWETDSKSMRALPRFRGFIENLGLDQYWRASGWADVCHPSGTSFVCD